MRDRKSKFISSFIILIIYSLAYLTISLWFSFYSTSNSMRNVFIADLIATGIVFTFSLIFNNSSIYDPYWSIVPPIIAVYLVRLFPQGDFLRQFIVVLLVFLWGIRLTLNWVRGWPGLKHQDWRYTQIANNTGKLYWPISFFGIHLMPTIFVFMGCLPLWFVLSSTTTFNFLDIVAALFTLGAIAIEFVADEQLIRFRKQQQEGGFLRSGLWAHSRHPNYLGEISFWLGIFLFVISSRSKGAYWTAVGFAAMVILFKFISVPLMERRNKKRREGYEAYAKEVPALIPNPFRRKRR